MGDLIDFTFILESSFGNATLVFDHYTTKSKDVEHPALKEKMMRSRFIISLCGISLLLLLLSLTISVQATVFNSEGNELNNTVIRDLLGGSHAIYTGPAILFYEISCTPCLPAVHYLNQYLISNPDADLIEYTGSTLEAQWQLEKLSTLHNRKFVNLPVIFIGPIGIEGTDDIIRYFNEIYSWYMHLDVSE